MELVGVACGFVTLLFLFYRYLTATFNFWNKRNVPGPDPIPIFGTMKDVILMKEFYGTYWNRLYNTYKDASFVGLFNMREPMLLIRDPNHIKNILIKDSSLFSARGTPYHPNAEPLLKFLLFLDGPIAQHIRATVSPAFTPSRLKEILKVMQESLGRLDNYIDALLTKSDCINCSDVITRLTADTISISLIGADMKTLSTETNEINEFLHYAALFRGTKGNQVIKKILSITLPQLYDLIGYRLFNNDKITMFYTNFTNDLMEYRKKHGIDKPDFVGLLMKLEDNPGNLAELIDKTGHFYAAHVFGFFTGGFETSAATITNTLYELALNQNIQDKLREEIRNVYAEYGQLTYDNINSMSYLNAIFKETIRKYPLANALPRRSTSSYTFRDTTLTIPKGQNIIIPVHAIHHDPKIYPQPEVYDPERFNDEAVRARDPMHYIPFGYGPRNCIGERLGILLTKVGLIAFLQKYKVDVCEKTVTSYKYHIVPTTLVSADAIYLKVTKLDLSHVRSEANLS